MYMGIFVLLTNYHTMLRPLSNKDGEKYRSWWELSHHEALERQKKRLFKRNAARQNGFVVDLNK